MENRNEERFILENHAKDGAGWFYWIAGLSLVNTAVSLFGGNWNFVIGLGITQIIDYLAYEIALETGNMVSIIAVVINVLIAGVFAMFGIFANKGRNWAYITGMILFGLDGLLFLLSMDVLSIGFHILAIVFIYRGYSSNRKLQAHDGGIQEAQEDVQYQGN